MKVFVKEWSPKNEITRYYVNNAETGEQIGFFQFNFEHVGAGEFAISRTSQSGDEAALESVLKIARERQPQLSDDAALGFVSRNTAVVYAGPNAKKKAAAQRKLTLEI